MGSGIERHRQPVLHRPWRRWRVALLSGAAALVAGAAAAQLSAPVPPATATAAPLAAAGGRIGPSLQRRLAAAAPAEALRVIVSFHGKGAPTTAQLDVLRATGVSGVHLRTFPIAGVVATPAQVRHIAGLPAVRSIYLDERLQYDNDAATALTSVRKLREDPVLTAHNGSRAYSGRGVTILVNDSGIDGTHDDLKYPEHVIQNVYAGGKGGRGEAEAVACSEELSPLGTCDSGIAPIPWIEDVPNTDFTTSHGTHVAGIAGGSGARSDGRYAGVAPGASLVGYGSGAALFVLDALGGFDYANANAERLGIRVVTNSFGNNGQINQPFDPEDPTVRVTQVLAEDRNMVVVFSAGNSGNGENTITGVFKKAPWIVVVANGTKDARLSASSSRGRINFRDSWTDPERGITYTLTDRPTVIAPGTSIVSTRPASVDPLAVAAAHADEANPQHTPFYMSQSGTSMAAPHVAGIVALMLEANPALGWREVKAILERTATNVADLGDWEGGAGYANAHAATAMAAQRAGSAVQGQDYGDTNRLYRPFNARAVLGVSPVGAEGEPSFTITYTPLNNPATGDNFATFEVGPRAHLVLASGNVDPNGTGAGQSTRVALQDPDGVLYSPGVGIPGGALSGWRFVTAPGKPGTWKVLIRGTCGLSGTVSVSVCAQGVETNGAGAPTIVDVFVKTVDILRFEGLPDVAGHARQADIERAIVNGLVDARANRRFQPDAPLTRIELADYLSLTPGLRQFLPLSGVPTFRDLGAGEIAEAEAATALGGMLLDANPAARAALELSGSKFKPAAKATRLQLAYGLVQALGLEAAAAAHEGAVVYVVDGEPREVTDLGGVPPDLLGYVQLALDRGLLAPVVSDATVLFQPAGTVTRAEYASAALAAAAAYAPRVP
jgi:serine protease AprX